MTPTSNQYTQAARALYHEPGELEIDELERTISRADGGAWVRAWVWVDDSDASKEAKQ